MKIHLTKSFAGLILILASAGVLYVACWPVFYIGFFGDDALFISLAQALLTGSYSSLYTAQPIPITDPLPGFPLLLVPFVKLFGPLSNVLRIPSLLATLLSGWMIFQILHKKTGNYFLSIGALILFLFNSSLVPYAGVVMAEPTFILSTVATVYFLNQEGEKSVWLAAVVLSLGCLLRPQGIIFLVAVIFYGILEKEYRKSIVLLIVGLVPLSLFLLRNIFLSHELSGYVSNLVSHLGTTTALPQLWSHIKGNLGVAFPAILFNVPAVSHPLLRSFLGWGSIFIGLCCATNGYLKYRHWPPIGIGGLYCVGTLGFLPFWFALDMRYILLLCPWLILVVILGLFDWMKSKERIKWFFVVLILWGGAHLAGNVRTIKDVLFKISLNRPKPELTFRWITEHTDRDEPIFSEMSPVVYIYTGRKSPLQKLWIPGNKAQFFQYARTNSIRFILLISDDQHLDDRYALLKRWTLEGSLVEVFKSNSEMTSILKVY